MSECNGAAPHVCPECSSPAYIGFGIPARCTQKQCIFYCVDLWVEWALLIPDDGMPKNSEPDFFLDIGDDYTHPGFPPLTFASVPITSAPTSWQIANPGTSDPSIYYRDFCTSCHIAVDFTRTQDAFSGSYYAFCTQCGQPNVWS